MNLICAVEGSAYFSRCPRALRSSETEENNEVWLHPTFGVLGIDAAVDAFVVDDRSINRHLYMMAHDTQAPILTTLDLLDDLASKRIISQDVLFADRTYLRQAGFQLIPLTAEELSYHLKNASLANGIFVETAELRASNYPPAEPGALFSVSRSKRLEGDADASPAHCAT